MSKRTFTAKVAGQEYEIPTSMAVINEAQEASGVSLMTALDDSGSTFGYLVQGAIYAGLKRLGIVEIDGKKLTYELVGESCDMIEAQQNYLALIGAMTPDLPAPARGKKRKNAKTEDPKSS